MWSPRAQCDRAKFIWSWREKLENTPNLHIWQDTVCELLVENGEVTGLVTAWGVTFKAKCIVLTAGTFLNGLMHVGRHQLPGGRMAEPASYQLTESIARHGITWAVPDEAGQRRVMELIYGQVKAGLPADPALFEAAAQPLREEGCGCVILGCTELSLLKRDYALGDGVLDTLEVLAAAALRDCGAPRKAAFADLLAPRPPRRG